MIRSLIRLKSFIVPYRLRLGTGVGAFGIARIFEALVPIFVAMGIDRIAAGVRSACTYAGARTIDEFHERALVGVQSSTGYAEGKPLNESW